MVLWQLKHSLLGIIAILQHAKNLEELWNFRMTTDDHAYGSPESEVSFTDLGTDHKFIMTKNSTDS